MEQNNFTIEVAGTEIKRETYIPKRRAECIEIYKNVLMKGTFCETTFDDFICWPPTEAGRNTSYPCPLVSSFKGEVLGYSEIPDAYATKYCDANGEWVGETDYNRCAKYVESLHESNQLQLIVEYITFTGCILSLVVLLLSLTIFFYFKCLRCPRLIVHQNLCMALVVNLILLLTLSTQRIFQGFAIFYSINWLCKAMLGLQMYSSLASINWMFVEGLLMHNKVVVNIFYYRAPFKMYYFIGWGFPTLVVGTWVTLMEKYHESYCWKYFNQSEFIYIVAIPMIVVLSINLVFLINIIRVILSKRPLNSSVERRQIKKAMKATIILFPLLGTTNLLFCVVPGNSDLQAVFSIANAFVQSTQGFFVGVLHCFLNTDVQNALMQAYRRSWLARTRERISRIRLLFQTPNTCATRSNDAPNIPMKAVASTDVVIQHDVDDSEMEVVASPLPAETELRVNNGSSGDESTML